MRVAVTNIHGYRASWHLHDFKLGSSRCSRNIDTHQSISSSTYDFRSEVHLRLELSNVSGSLIFHLTLVMTCSAVVLALQCRTVIDVFTRLAPSRPRPLPRTAASDENACRMIISLPQPSGPTRMNGSLFSIHGSIILRVR